MFIFSFALIVFVVSFVHALIKPVPIGKSLREGVKLFFTTAAGLCAVALIVHLASI